MLGGMSRSTICAIDKEGASCSRRALKREGHMNTQMNGTKHLRAGRLLAAVLVIAAVWLVYSTSNVFATKPFDYATALRSWVSAFGLLIGAWMAWRDRAQRAWAVV